MTWRFYWSAACSWQGYSIPTNIAMVTWYSATRHFIIPFEMHNHTLTFRAFHILVSQAPHIYWNCVECMEFTSSSLHYEDHCPLFQGVMPWSLVGSYQLPWVLPLYPPWRLSQTPPHKTTWHHMPQDRNPYSHDHMNVNTLSLDPPISSVNDCGTAAYRLCLLFTYNLYHIHEAKLMFTLKTLEL